jgi:DHA1 family inner membrane transport protein
LLLFFKKEVLPSFYTSLTALYCTGMKNLPLPLIALALSAFAIGTTEFVIMGLLPQVAANLGVSIPAAGWLVSGYALGVFIGAPIMAIATQKLPPRAALLILMGIFVIGNLLCALAPGYTFLMLARIITSLCHGAFFGIGAVEAASLVPPNRRASAIALMFTGLTLANVLGVPLGTALGQAAGWRVTFWAVVGLGIAAFIGLFLLLPRDKPHDKKPAMMAELAALRPNVWLALLITVVSSASMFAIFTYVAPLLNKVTGVSPRVVTYTLFLIGIGMTVGNTIGGKLSDWRPHATLVGVFPACAIVLILLGIGAHDLAVTELALFTWAAIAFAGCSALQMNAVNLGRAAPNLISTLNIGAFNAGNALGAWVGGEVLLLHLGYDAIPPTAAGLAIGALALTVYSLRPSARLAPNI